MNMLLSPLLLVFTISLALAHILPADDGNGVQPRHKVEARSVEQPNLELVICCAPTHAGEPTCPPPEMPKGASSEMQEIRNDLVKTAEGTMADLLQEIKLVASEPLGDVEEDANFTFIPFQRPRSARFHVLERRGDGEEIDSHVFK